MWYVHTVIFIQRDWTSTKPFFQNNITLTVAISSISGLIPTEKCLVSYLCAEKAMSSFIIGKLKRHAVPWQ